MDSARFFLWPLVLYNEKDEQRKALNAVSANKKSFLFLKFVLA
ncbi:conserved hypothetical protein [Chlamydia pneumoniae LPCoLN]|uniref:Uncharacterized protein n=1 Tax=Chlamydia pneumoniae TaxID=83558 RepID=A0A0F7WRN3_CHLPN|nr:conserved hypothetical protein [Chlamydia pneumoniae LPCoLN]ETR80632.1 hypothetical protein X556_0039 [Chlamydia pneumoniae B21]CRI33233.1 Uncharacterized protein BN1224_Wien1_A_07400 [Chlamydia pneumoniae]CRI36096.1 Uncharacterized protein BN1224_CM1_A_07430 [Chlamydia pneumoniae]CRI37223.1 Uncharacterized protein BN1224_CV14_A_07420 [Chlamydia pneumoniae]